MLAINYWHSNSTVIYRHIKLLQSRKTPIIHQALNRTKSAAMSCETEYLKLKTITKFTTKRWVLSGKRCWQELNILINSSILRLFINNSNLIFATRKKNRQNTKLNSLRTASMKRQKWAVDYIMWVSSVKPKRTTKEARPVFRFHRNVISSIGVSFVSCLR